jgi:D-alanyl-D-alanine carboxypeptidase/D-alanyl-D-alanine-endopeptidase (penicillin-binding protein 4)
VRLRLALCSVAVAATAVSSPHAATGDLSAGRTKSLRSPSLSLARTAAIAVDADTGTVLYAHNDALPVHPASNEKLPVSWAALTRLGTGFRFTTEVVGVGRRAGRVWNGDLYLRSNGDPTLSSADIAGLAATLRARGIRRVTGRIRGDESAFDQRRGGNGWKRYFVGGESPPLSALVVDRAQGWPALSPPLLAARVLREALVARKISVGGRIALGIAPGDAVPLATDTSAPLSSIVQRMNQDSDNFTAEMLLKHLGTLDGGLGTSARGAAVVIAEMRAAGIPTAGVRLVDGSGLSSLDRMTARTLVAVIRAGLENPGIRDAFVSSLAVAGRSGTLRTRLPTLAGIVRGKTGTTDLACSLSGLVSDSIVFAVLQNGAPVAYWSARTAQDRFVLALARSLSRSGQG